MYSIRHYVIKYIEMLLINYEYRIYCFEIGKMVVYREHICPIPKIRYDNCIHQRSHLKATPPSASAQITGSENDILPVTPIASIEFSQYSSDN